jgi:hypothetical protein
MGNLCPWCKTTDDSQLDNNVRDGSTSTNSQRSLTSSQVNDRTPFVLFINSIFISCTFFPRLLDKTGTHNQYNQPITPVILNAPTNVEPSSHLTSIVPPPPPPVIHTNHTQSTTGKLSKFILSRI